MDTLKSHPGLSSPPQPKMDWNRPELLRLDVKTGTQNGSGVTSPDGNYGENTPPS